METLEKLPTFIEAENSNGIKILFEECKKNISIGTLSRLSNFEVGKVAMKQLPLRYLKPRKSQTAVPLR